MAEYTLRELELAKELPGYEKGPAKVLKLTLEDAAGQTQTAEMFTMASTPFPIIGEKIEGEISDSPYGPKFSRPRKGGGKGAGGGGYRRSPGETKAIQRQHSQEMALRREANLIAAGHRPLDDEQMQELITWFESDIAGGKIPRDKGVVQGILTSDVPADDSGLPK